MPHKATWMFLVSDALAAGLPAAVPERIGQGLLMLGFHLVMALVPAAIRVAGWWSKRLLGDDVAA